MQCCIKVVVSLSLRIYYASGRAISPSQRESWWHKYDVESVPK